MSFLKKATGGESGNSDGNMTAIEIYTNSAFKFIILFIPMLCLCASLTITVLHLIGYYPYIDDIQMWVFDLMDVFFLGLGIYFLKTSYGKDGLLIKKRLTIAKYVTAITTIIQWNVISYTWPFMDFWAFSVLFTIVYVFFFDTKLVLFETAGICISMFLSWFLEGGGMLLPPRDEYFVANMTFRLVGIVLMLSCVNIITVFCRRFLNVGADYINKVEKAKAENIEIARIAQMKSDFLANMSHEIRTPMNAVIGMAEIAAREDISPAARDSLIQIQKSGQNLLNIINDILDFSKIESGKMEIVPEKYELASELNDISNILATRIGDKKLELFVVTDPSIPGELLGDSMRIRQVIINLVNNAIKFTKEGSVSISVAGDLFEDDSVMLVYHIKDTGIGINKADLEKLFTAFSQIDSRRNRSVEGTGLGLAISKRLVESMGGELGVDSEFGKGSDFWFKIPQKVLDRRPALQVQDTEKKRAFLLDQDTNRRSIFYEEISKIGIESTIIKSLDEYSPSGGKDFLFLREEDFTRETETFLDSHPDLKAVVLTDLGSVFKSDRPGIYLLRRPISTLGMVNAFNGAHEEASRKDQKESFETDFAKPDARVLVVDDNNINLKVMEGLLSHTGLSVESAQSGPEAIEKLKENAYDIVFMDHMMPEMDGIDTTKIIRDTIAGKDRLPIIALTANAMEGSKQMFLDAGMNDFVAKPIDTKELIRKIKKWLPPEKLNSH